MITNYQKTYSHSLQKDMEFKVYGYSGITLLAFPSQDGRFYDYENRGLIETISTQIDQGRVMVISCDSIDQDSFSADWMNNQDRIQRYENFYHYIIDELIPYFLHLYPHQSNKPLITTGCSLGAFHALNFLLRTPDMIDGCICLSGAYSMYPFYGSYSDETVYLNSPIDYINGMSYDHPFVEKYRHKKIYLCVGQGDWEHPMLEDTHRIQELFQYKNIPAHIDYWGNDVSHDWPWWEKQFPYYVNLLLQSL